MAAQTEVSSRRPYALALLADIHGNFAALQAVLAELRTHPHHRMVVAGDLALGGPRPAETLNALQLLDATVIQGNSDRRLVRGRNVPAVQWGRDAIGAERLDWLTRLPFDCRVTPPGGTTPTDDLLVVHATPTDISAVLTVQPDPAGLLEVTSEERAQQLLGDARAGLIVGGHVHYASGGVAAGRRFATVGSVGFPWDGDHRAAYALATWEPGRKEGWTLTHHRVAYNYQAVIDDRGRVAFTPYRVQAFLTLLAGVSDALDPRSGAGRWEGADGEAAVGEEAHAKKTAPRKRLGARRKTP